IERHVICFIVGLNENLSKRFTSGLTRSQTVAGERTHTGSRLQTSPRSARWGAPFSANSIAGHTATTRNEHLDRVPGNQLFRLPSPDLMKGVTSGESASRDRCALGQRVERFVQVVIAALAQPLDVTVVD